jgi:hypothetical protein
VTLLSRLLSHFQLISACFPAVIPVDSPDPGVFYDEASSTWYAYATNGNGKKCVHAL